MRLFDLVRSAPNPKLMLETCWTVEWNGAKRMLQTKIKEEGRLLSSLIKSISQSISRVERVCV